MVFAGALQVILYSSNIFKASQDMHAQVITSATNQSLQLSIEDTFFQERGGINASSKIKLNLSLLSNTLLTPQSPLVKYHIEPTKVNHVPTEANPNTTPMTYGKTSKNSLSVQCRRMRLNLVKNQSSIIGSFGEGRLGNKMSNFASAFAMAEEYGLYNYISAGQYRCFRRVFNFPNILDTTAENKVYLWKKGKCMCSLWAYSKCLKIQC